LDGYAAWPGVFPAILGMLAEWDPPRLLGVFVLDIHESRFVGQYRVTKDGQFLPVEFETVCLAESKILEPFTNVGVLQIHGITPLLLLVGW
jgi:hypothetical protein